MKVGITRGVASIYLASTGVIGRLRDVDSQSDLLERFDQINWFAILSSGNDLVEHKPKNIKLSEWLLSLGCEPVVDKAEIEVDGKKAIRQFSPCLIEEAFAYVTEDVN